MADDEYIVEVNADLNESSVRRVSAELESSLDDVEVDVNVDRDAAIASIREVMTDFAKSGRDAGDGFADGFEQSTRGRFAKVGDDAAKEIDRKVGSSGDRSGRGFIRRFADAVSSTVESVAVGFTTALQGGIISNPITAKLVFGTLLATTPAIAAAVSSLLVTGIGAGIAGIGIAFAAQSKIVKKAFSDMADDVSSTMRRAAQPLEGVLVHVAAEIETVFDNLEPAFTRAFDSMTPSLNRFVDRLGSAFSGLGPQIESFTDAFNKQIDGLSESGGLQDTIDALEDLANTLEGDELGNFIDWLDEVGAGAVGVIEDLVAIYEGLEKIDKAAGKFAEGDFSGGLDDLKESLSGDWMDGARQEWDNFWQTIRGEGDAPLAKIIQGWNSAEESIATWMEGVGDAIGEGFMTGLSKIGDFWGFIKGQFEAFVDNVKGFFGISSPSTVFMSIGSDIIAGLVQGLQTGWAVISGFFASLPGRIMGALGNAGSWLLGVGTRIINGLVGGLQAAWGAVAGFFTSLPGRIIGFLGNAGSWLLGIGRSIMNGLRTGAQNAWKAVSGFFAGIPGRIVKVIGKVGNLLQRVGGDILRGLGRGAQNAWKSVRNFFRDLPDNIRKTVGNLLNLLQKTGGDILRGLGRGAQNIWRNVRTWFANLPDNIRNAVGNLGNLLAEAGRNAIQSLRDGAGAAWDRVVGWFRDIPGKVRDAVTGVASGLYTAGKNLVGDLADGIWAGITGPLEGALASLRAKAADIRDLWPLSPIKAGPLKAWNNHSPGKKLMQMLADGIIEGAPEIDRAMVRAVRPLSMTNPTIRGGVSMTSGGMIPDYGSSAERFVRTAAVGNTVVNQNYYGPTTSGDRLREMTWTLRYATGYRGPQSFEGVR